MRKRLLSCLALGLLAGAACATWALPATDPAGPSAAGIDLSRRADRQLLAYGEAHPDCAMWTNWEKLCSRIGPGGSVDCTIDPDRRVAPSRPFCARPVSGLDIEPDPAERPARERFCLRRNSPEAPARRIRFCTHQDPRRPFNGQRVAALIRTGCDGLSDEETGRMVCVRGGDANAHIPDCAALAATHYRTDRLLACAIWSGPRSCAAYPIRSSEQGEITFGAPDPNVAAVHGLSCENK